MPNGKKLMRRSRPAGESPASKNDDPDSSQGDESGTNASRGRNIELTNKTKAQTKNAVPKARSTANYRRPSDSHVLDSDLEDAPLLVEDIDSFLIGAGSTGDPYDGYYEGTRVQWEYQQDRRGGHMLFIENEETGELVLTDINGDGSGGGVGGAELEGDFEETPLLRGEDGESAGFQLDANRGLQFSIMDKFFLSSYLFFQGLLAGFVLALVYLIEQAGSDTELLVNYQPSSNEIRRILFIFGAISFVGALESFSDSWRRRRYSSARSGIAELGGKSGEGSKGQTNRADASDTDSFVTHAQLEGFLLPLTWASLICFFIMFILLLVMAPSEVLISQKNGLPTVDGEASDAWVAVALDDEAFSDLFDRWKKLSLYRVGFGLMGWLLSCLVVMLRYLLSSKRDIAMNGMYEYIYTLRKKISSLQGDSFDPKMSVEDYQRLINIQKLGVQRSEAALRAKEEHALEDFQAAV